MRKTLSIIIPAFNEQRIIGACLDAIAAQTEAPDEVIVVDNNSTDRTVEIAKSYPFVTLVRETQQGRAHARNAGFDAASGELLGRINANSILAPDWVARAREAWESYPELGGISGASVADSLPYTHILRSKLWTRLYYVWSEVVLRVRVLFGANMVITREAWRAMRMETCTDDTLVHEDQDLSLLLAGHGYDVHYDHYLVCDFEGQSYSRWPKLHAYMRLRDDTKRRHKKLGTYTRPEAKVLPLWHKIIFRVGGAPVLGIFLGASIVLYWIVRALGQDPMAHTE